MPALSDAGWHKVEMNVTYIPEHVKTWYMLQIQWFITWLMMKKASIKLASDNLEWHVMQFPNKKTGDVFWQAGIWKSVSCISVVLWLKVGTLSTVFFTDMMCELSCPFSQKAPVETHLSLCTLPPNLIVCNLLMTYVGPVQLMHYYLFFCL